MVAVDSMSRGFADVVFVKIKDFNVWSEKVIAFNLACRPIKMARLSDGLEITVLFLPDTQSLSA